jgi:hypothetical protein
LSGWLKAESGLGRGGFTGGDVARASELLLRESVEEGVLLPVELVIPIFGEEDEDEDDESKRSLAGFGVERANEQAATP